MLDVGVGAGRTSQAFGEPAGRYLGVDYSPGMIAACEQRFSTMENHLEFKVADARAIREVGAKWDLIFFSFNGVDHLEEPDRRAFFRDVQNMLSPEGLFWFSSHNIRSLPSIYEARFKKGAPLMEQAQAALSWLMVRLVNPARSKLANRQHAMILDGAYGFGVRSAYCTVDETLRQLKLAGFDKVKVISMDGSELPSKDYGVTTDSWLTYLCS